MNAIEPTTSLADLRQRILAARANPVALPARTAEIARRHRSARQKDWSVSDVVVTRDGQLRTIQETGREATVSRITTEVFATAPFDEDLFARRHLPSSAIKFHDGLHAGWIYNVLTDLGDTFQLFMYRDDSLRRYRVRLVAPQLELLGVPHETHIYGDGHLCISADSYGQQMLNVAYARSVMWCHGISLMVRGHAWPWGE